MGDSYREEIRKTRKKTVSGTGTASQQAKEAVRQAALRREYFRESSVRRRQGHKTPPYQMRMF